MIVIQYIMIFPLDSSIFPYSTPMISITSRHHIADGGKPMRGRVDEAIVRLERCPGGISCSGSAVVYKWGPIHITYGMSCITG